MLDGGVHVHHLIVLGKAFGISTSLFGNFLVEGFPVLLDRVFCVLVDGDLDDAVILELGLLATEVFEVGVAKSFFDSKAVVRVEDEDLLE